MTLQICKENCPQTRLCDGERASCRRWGNGDPLAYKAPRDGVERHGRRASGEAPGRRKGQTRVGLRAKARLCRHLRKTSIVIKSAPGIASRSAKPGTIPKSVKRQFSTGSPEKLELYRTEATETAVSLETFTRDVSFQVWGKFGRIGLLADRALRALLRAGPLVPEQATDSKFLPHEIAVSAMPADWRLNESVTRGIGDAHFRADPSEWSLLMTPEFAAVNVTIIETLPVDFNARLWHISKPDSLTPLCKPRSTAS